MGLKGAFNGLNPLRLRAGRLFRPHEAAGPGMRVFTNGASYCPWLAVQEKR